MDGISHDGTESVGWGHVVSDSRLGEELGGILERLQNQNNQLNAASGT